MRDFRPASLARYPPPCHLLQFSLEPCNGQMSCRPYNSPHYAVPLRSMLRGEGGEGNGRMDQLLLFQGFLDSRISVLHMIRVFQRATALVPIQLLGLFSG